MQDVDPKAITLALGGDWHGGFGLVPGPGHSRRDRSVKISRHPSDPKDILLHSFAGDDWRSIKDSYRAQGLLPERGAQQAPPAAARQRAQRAQERGAREAARTAADAGKIAKIIAGCGSIEGTPAEMYLLSRNIPSPYRMDLRFRTGLWTKDRDARLVQAPAMVALVRRWGCAEPTGLHRTLLTNDGKKHPAVGSAKKMQGSVRGGGIWPDDVRSILAVCEGIETSLSLQKLLNIPTVAALSAGNLVALVIPDQVNELVIGADNDRNGVGVRAAREAMVAHWRPWRSVRIVRPERSKDFNDLCGASNGRS
jgi:putative DNA primase/helicase